MLLQLSPTTTLTSAQLVCHDGTMQLNNPCAPGRCIWREDAKSAFCSAYADVADEEVPEQLGYPSEPGCGFAKEAGEKCPTIIKEGHHLCDKGCKNIVSLGSSIQIDSMC